MSNFRSLPRGFKARSERISAQYRNELGLCNHHPICGFELAKHLDIQVYTPIEIFGSSVDLTALIGEKKGFSAMTMITKRGNRIIIHNPSHSPQRQQSNLMHELAHILCKHNQNSNYGNHIIPSMMRDFDMQQEDEATYLGGTLQLPREGLIKCLYNNMSEEAIANYYNCSTQMVKFRINITGVKHQLKQRW